MTQFPFFYMILRIYLWMKWVSIVGLVVLLWNYLLCKVCICCLVTFLFLCYFLIITCLKKITSLGTCWIQGKIGVLFRMSLRCAHLSAYKSKPLLVLTLCFTVVANHVSWLGNTQRIFWHLSLTLFYVLEIAGSECQPLILQSPCQ